MTEGTDDVPKEEICPVANGTTHRLTSKRLQEGGDSTTTEPKIQQKEQFVPRIKWPDLTVQIFIHGGCLYGIFLMITSAKLLTSLFGKLTLLTFKLSYRERYCVYKNRSDHLQHERTKLFDDLLKHPRYDDLVASSPKC
ncbi:hypothetical protein ILUMI_16399 [Ignelater luminosus]|uniref:Uncharacterized protein n=1 Tax=Ignelater luminosus TaxID=2038154 RepID=A0A8K0CNN6_IGNLU|nr:hypothetical protein ILUMI_16399 [Ignelater luminosus]